jgi:hypothetical protein
MGTPPSHNVLTFDSSLSTQVTWWPISAKQTDATSPTYPDPITQIEIGSDICLLSPSRLPAGDYGSENKPVNIESVRKTGPQWLELGSERLLTREANLSYLAKIRWVRVAMITVSFKPSNVNR